MTRPDPDSPATPPAPRPDADYRWTSAKAAAFLGALAACGKVAAAARAVGMTRQSAYRLRARAPLVAQAWPLALAAGRERGQEWRQARGRGKAQGRGGAPPGCSGQGHPSQGYVSQGASVQGDTTGAAR
ncbi:hypothetical protein A9995_13940 [Erythrobacter sp. QSSC1-22B]|uniref:hypothetical protein n=1 Tax=Erythrobacter sp. QSSC1-22B TaxID=1860125 RepID=UPI00080518A5|nr:hypothetical protein [Erythrobacter sp. QSSC1-22B]OBX18035.1 hypothetical protein A9995_13940 [Erythrobacter sp. QSSC1-22B]